jgi:XRE family transcriptional regulator, fatty acid utilization regulator
MLNVGQRIRQVREELGMPGAVLARRVGVAKNHLYLIEHEKRTPSLGLLEKIARELRVEPSELLEEPALASPGKDKAPQDEAELHKGWQIEDERRVRHVRPPATRTEERARHLTILKKVRDGELSPEEAAELLEHA